ncbi:MAG: hypothetical protein M0Z53_09185 [Thermaerobacter sp.]|nr:hypothetical protein [Thermaerobacter sp.]
MGRTLAGIGIAVNLFIPGVGTLIMGKWLSGGLQVAGLALVGLLHLISIGLLGFVFGPVAALLWGGIWVWALVGGILTYVDRRIGGRDPRRLGSS